MKLKRCNCEYPDGSGKINPKCPKHTPQNQTKGEYCGCNESLNFHCPAHSWKDTPSKSVEKICKKCMSKHPEKECPYFKPVKEWEKKFDEMATLDWYHHSTNIGFTKFKDMHFYPKIKDYIKTNFISRSELEGIIDAGFNRGNPDETLRRIVQLIKEQ